MFRFTKAPKQTSLLEIRTAFLHKAEMLVICSNNAAQLPFIKLAVRHQPQLCSSYERLKNLYRESTSIVFHWHLQI